jgi:capsular exopolysaccharide synthesis family protein
MERIKIAIQKAKALRGSGAAPPRKTVRRSIRSESADDSELEDISYDETRLVELNRSHLKSNRIVAFDKTDPASVAFDHLRTQVLNRLRANNWKSIAIASPTPQCGKTMVAVNLAMSLAHQTTLTVLLADLDLRRPKVAQYLGFDCETGLVDYLEGEASLAAVLVNPGLPRLVILPNDRSVLNPAELLSSSQTQTMVEELKGRYESRVILFDLPPLLPTDDAMAFLGQVDCVLLVLAEGQTTKSDIEASLRLLEPYKLLGTVLNKSNRRQTPYY